MPNVSDSEKPLVYVSRLTNAEKNGLYAVRDAFPLLDIRRHFDEALQEVAIDRLILAEDHLKTALHLLQNSTKPSSYRAAVNRAYYAVHHSIRVMLLQENNCESDGHQEAINEFKDKLKDRNFRTKCGLNEDVLKEVAEARDNRNVADYSPYDFSRLEKTTNWIPLTGHAWKAAAEFNVNLAERLLQSAKKFIGLA